MRLLIIISMLFTLTDAAAQSVFDRRGCENFGADWAPASMPPWLGTCELKSSKTIPQGDFVEIGPNVLFLVDSGTTLSNNGHLFLHDAAELRIEDGLLHNNGTLELHNQATLSNNAGNIVNDGTIQAEGDLLNNVVAAPHHVATRGVYNYGMIQLLDGGHLVNVGRVMSLGSGSVTVDLGGQFSNRGSGQFYPNDDQIHGRLVNESDAIIDNERILTIRANGELENHGQIYNGGIGFPDDNGEDRRGLLWVNRDATLRNEPGGKIHNAEGRITVAGKAIIDSSSLINAVNGVLRTTFTGVVDITGSGRLTNEAGGEINNGGWIRVGCSGWVVNNGSWTGKPLWSEPCIRPFIFLQGGGL